MELDGIRHRPRPRNTRHGGMVLERILKDLDPGGCSGLEQVEKESQPANPCSPGKWPLNGDACGLRQACTFTQRYTFCYNRNLVSK